jgi:hypothetical protein
MKPMIYIAARFKGAMKKSVFEKSFVVALFVLVMVLFAFAERDTQKAFEKYNTKTTLEISKKSVDYTAEAPQKTLNNNAASRN